jgi:hypothetical protein
MWPQPAFGDGKIKTDLVFGRAAAGAEESAIDQLD